MNFFKKILQFFGFAKPVPEITVDTILTSFHEKLEELKDHAATRTAEAAREAEEAKRALAKAEKAKGEVAKAERVYAKLADLVGAEQ